MSLATTTTTPDADVRHGAPDATYKTLDADVQRQVDPGSDVDVVCWMTTSRVDDENEVMLPEGADFERFDKNRIVLLMHALGQPGNYYPLPVGKVLWHKVRPGLGILAGVKFSTRTNMGQEVKSLFEEGMLRTFSIGFKPDVASPMTPEESQSRPDWLAAYQKARGRILVHRKYKVLELSVAPVPMNEDALVTTMVGKGRSIPQWVQLSRPANLQPRGTHPMPDPENAALAPPESPDEHDATDLPPLTAGPKTKAAVPYHNYPEDDSEWDAGEARAQFKEYAGGEGEDFDPEKYRLGFAVVDGDPKELGSYKFPHHYVRDGKIVTNRRGVAAAIAAAHGARSGETPAGSQAALAHLKKHAEELGLPSGEGDGEGKAFAGVVDRDGDGDGDLPPLEHPRSEGLGDEDYRKMCQAAVATYRGLRQSGKAVLHASQEEQALHHEMHEDDLEPGHGHHKPHEIRDAYQGATSFKSITVDTAPPEGAGFEKIFPGPPHSGCRGCPQGTAAEDEMDMPGKAMTEASGVAGGFAVPPGDRRQDDPVLPAQFAPGEEPGMVRAGDFVRVRRHPEYPTKGVGQVISIHKNGLVPDVEEDIFGTDDEPAGRVRLYKSYRGGHRSTRIYVGHPVSHLEKIDDLNPPTARPVKSLMPYREPAPEPEPAPLPPLPAAPAPEVILPPLPYGASAAVPTPPKPPTFRAEDITRAAADGIEAAVARLTGRLL